MKILEPSGKAFARRQVQANLRVKVVEFAALDEQTLGGKGGGPGLAGLSRAQPWPF
jgi:hypothetical protein